MLTDEEKKKIKSILPHGSRKKIAILAGVSIQAVGKYFNRGGNSDIIEDVVLDYYRTYKENKEAKKSGLF